MKNEESQIKANINRNEDSSKESANQWTEFAAQLVDKITGKDVMITYEFDDFEIDVPKAVGPNGQDLGSAKWKISGKIMISSQVNAKY
ncbi:MAG TPA: hypothetical protein VF220_03640 [Nitrososphaeraceae archaeon]